jgi:hypothetical protein
VDRFFRSISIFDLGALVPLWCDCVFQDEKTGGRAMPLTPAKSVLMRSKRFSPRAERNMDPDETVEPLIFADWHCSGGNCTLPRLLDVLRLTSYASHRIFAVTALSLSFCS